MFVLPAHLAGLQFVADNQFLVLALLLREGVVAGDGEGGTARADAVPPQFFGRLGLPVARQANAMHHAVAIAAEKLRIIGLLVRGQLDALAARLDFQVVQLRFDGRRPFPLQPGDAGAADGTVEIQHLRQSIHQAGPGDSAAEQHGQPLPPADTAEKQRPEDQQQRRTENEAHHDVELHNRI